MRQKYPNGFQGLKNVNLTIDQGELTVTGDYEMIGSSRIPLENNRIR